MKKFKFTHLSDTHGTWPGLFSENFPIPDSSELIFHSGDIAPNIPRNLRGKSNFFSEEEFQKNWWHGAIPLLKEELKGRPFVFIRGNHDFFNPIDLLVNADIQTFNVEFELVEICGLKIYGFPNIPYICGEWNFETKSSEMSDLVSTIPDCDILLAHCPPTGLCSGYEEGKPDGNSQLMNHLLYNAQTWPRYLLAGHHHEARGITQFNCDGGMIVSNAATTMHNFEMEK